MSDDRSLVPFQDIERMAAVMGKTKMFGKSPEELLPLMLIAQAEGKHPAIAAQEYDIIQGRPAINSKSALARFQAAGGSIAWTKRTDTEVGATFRHPLGGELAVTWNWARAEKAGLTGKDNWKKYPLQMLASRVVAEGVRAVFPACLSALYTVEEVQDMEPLRMPPQPEPAREEPRNVTPPPAPRPEPQPDPVKDRIHKLMIDLAPIPEEFAVLRKEMFKLHGPDTDAVIKDLEVRTMKKAHAKAKAAIAPDTPPVDEPPWEGKIATAGTAIETEMIF